MEGGSPKVVTCPILRLAPALRPGGHSKFLQSLFLTSFRRSSGYSRDHFRAVISKKIKRKSSFLEMVCGAAGWQEIEKHRSLWSDETQQTAKKCSLN